MNKVHCAFIKDSRVVNVAVFDSQDDELANRIVQENGYNEKVWATDFVPSMYSFWDGEKFQKASNEYLFSIGVIESYIDENGVYYSNADTEPKA